jgi:hypothetical protein
VNAYCDFERKPNAIHSRQVLAMSAANMLIVNLALPFSLSTLVIANLHHSGVELSMDDTLASWFGEALSSLIYLFISLSIYFSYIFCLFVFN